MRKHLYNNSARIWWTNFTISKFSKIHACLWNSKFFSVIGLVQFQQKYYLSLINTYFNIDITLDKVLLLLFFPLKSTDICLIFPQNHMLLVLIRSATEALLMSIHNIHFHRDIRKIYCGYPFINLELWSRRLTFISIVLKYILDWNIIKDKHWIYLLSYFYWNIILLMYDLSHFCWK